MTIDSSEKLRVFLSWSMQRSEAAAQAFRDWLPSVLQNVKPYYTPDDIGKGARWSSEIRNELESSDFGIIFLTPENLGSPWLLFEAGALSKLEKSHVAPLLIGVEPTDVTGPLAQLQLTKFNKEECLKLVKALNSALGSRALEPAVLANVFEKWWPDLAEKIQTIVETNLPAAGSQKRTDRDLLEEVVERLRALQAPKDSTLAWSRNIAAHRAVMNKDQLEAHAAYRREMMNSLQVLPLENFDFISIRSANALRAAGITSLADVVAMSKLELLKVPNLGKSGLLQIVDGLRRFGIELSDEDGFEGS